MQKVLVTGSNGFIGSHVVNELRKREILPLNFNRHDNDLVLERVCGECDSVIHLAGEVKPWMSNSDFSLSNVGLTEDLLRLLRKRSFSVNLVFASSVHVEHRINSYGITKYEAEQLVLTYARESDAFLNIFRLPHVFGEGCKPEYNSVLTTWICNALSGTTSVVYDRTKEMIYSDVTDVAAMMVNAACGSGSSERATNPYVEVPAFTITLGRLHDLIHELAGLDLASSSPYKDPFRARLHRTIEFYKFWMLCDPSISIERARSLFFDRSDVS